MKSIHYALLISMVLGFSAFSQAQTNPSDTPKVKKSSPVPSRPVTPPPSARPSSSQPVTPGSPGVKRSSPVSTPRISKQRTNSVQPSTTAPIQQAAPSTSTTTSVPPIDHNRPAGNGMFNIGLVAGVPQGEFATNTNDNWGWGLDVSLLFNLGQKRPKREWADNPLNVYMGAAFQYMYFGGKTDTYSYNDQFSETTIDSKVNNNMWGLGFLTRAEFFTGPVKPFVEVTAGVRFFNGSHRVEYENSLYNSFDPDDTRRQTFSNSLGSSPVGYYGAAGGLRIGSEKVRVELKMSYIKGSKAEYVDLDKIEFDRTDNSITYTTKKSTTDMLVPQLALSLIF